MIKGGPKIINDGLVLCLDAHDAKSYAGEPTTNFSTNPKFETGTHDSSSGGTWNNWVFGTWNSYNHKIVDVTDAGMIASGFTKALRVTSDGASNSQHLSNNNWGSNITAGTVFSLSFWGRASASDTTWIYSQWGGTVGYPEFTTEWKYFKFDNITKAAGSGSQYPYFRFEYGPPPSGQWFEVTGFQVEAKSYSTPLADTSRSATNGWVDRSGNSNSGTLTNMIGTEVTHYRDGQVIMPVANSYLDFDGSNDYVDCGSVTPDTGDFTVEFIYQLTGNGGRGGLFERKAGSPYNGFSLGQGGSGHWGFTVSGTSNFSAGSYLDLTWTYPALNTWYHDVGVYSGGNSITIYRNGLSVSSTSGTTQGNLSTQGTRTNFLIANRDNSTSLPCKVGLVRVYNKALTAAEVLSNYNTTKSRFS